MARTKFFWVAREGTGAAGLVERFGSRELGGGREFNCEPFPFVGFEDADNSEYSGGLGKSFVLVLVEVEEDKAGESKDEN